MPAPADGDGIAAEERARERGRGRRVPDAHVSERHDVRARAEELVRESLPSAHRLGRLLPRHGRPRGGVVRTRPEPEVADGRMRKRLDHPGVHDYELRSSPARKDADCGAAGREVAEHLPRDLLRVRAHALPRHAVIRRRDDDRGA